MMFGLPEKTEISKQLSKERVFAKFKVNTATQETFNADIMTMFLTGRISPETVPALKPGKNVQGFYILTLNMRHEGCNRKNLELLAKAIPQKMIFALRFEETVQFAVFYENLYATEIMPVNEAKLNLDGTDLDEVWENFVKSIGGIVIEGENTLVEQIAVNEEREALVKKIEELTAKAYKEKQARRKMELIKQVKELQSQLENL